MSHTTEYSKGLHIFVFCCADYRNIVNDCINSIEKFVTDPILSRNIVSNTDIDIAGYNLIKDRELWSMLDPEFKYRNLYNHNWIKQQIFKLNLNKLVTGDILVVDAEVRFQKKIQWFVNDQQHLVFYKQPSDVNGVEFVKQLVKINADASKNFITEAIIFSTEILTEIHNTIEKAHGMPQLSTYQTVIFNDPDCISPLPKLFMSEYELYANYLLTYHSEKVFKLIEYNPEFFYSKQFHITSNSRGNQTEWLTFYEQIKDPSWPSCTQEEDFSLLPDHIQHECINIFGYQPKFKNGN
jgi:hypothetical protein